MAIKVNLGEQEELTARVTGFAGGGGGSFTLYPATETRLGGVKVGDGLNITSDGVLSVEGGVGEDGYSPTINVNDIAGGTRLTIRDINGEKTVDVMDGKDGSNGKDGVDGVTPEFSIGTVATLSAGSNATASITGTKENPVLNLGIPKGKDGGGSAGGGADGEDGGYYIPSVNNSGDLSWTPTKSDMPGVPSVNIKGAKGDPGYTPQKNVDYFDGEDGEPGQDGVSATHSWNGTVLTITSAAGTSSADLKGEKGETGPPGPQGEPGVSEGAVLYTAQSLTDGQKEQARNNIGAFSNVGGVLFGASPSIHNEINTGEIAIFNSYEAAGGAGIWLYGVNNTYSGIPGGARIQVHNPDDDSWHSIDFTKEGVANVHGSMVVDGPIFTGNAVDTRNNLGAAAKSVAISVPLYAAAWVDKVQTVYNIDGITTNNHIVVTPAPESYVDWGEAVVRCTHQGDKSLTFTCNTAPSVDLAAAILIMG